MAEIWSPSTGDYDIRVKLADYQRCGDLDVWLLHPFERTLTTWVRQPDGSYVESVYRHGVVALTALPGRTIDVDTLFA